MPAVVHAEVEGHEAVVLGVWEERLLDVEPPPELVEELALAHREILDDPVVRQDLHVVVREENGQEVAGLLHLGQVAGRPRGGGAAVVAVGDVEHVHAGEGLDDGLTVGQRPDGVLDVVLGPEVVQRLALHGLGDGCVDGVVAAVRQHHGLSVGPLLQQVARPVVFLVGASVLVLEDHVGVVLGGGHEADDAGLRPPVHDEAVDVEARHGVADEGLGGGQRAERLGALRVDLIGVLIGALRQIDLGTDDVEERVLVARREGAGLVDRDDVVGDRGDVLGEFGRGSERPERTDGGHEAKRGAAEVR